MNQYVDEKSDKVVVPMKLSNKEGSPSAEMVEGRTLPEGNSQQTTVDRTQSRVATSSGLLSVRQAAQARKDVRFSALLHHIDVELLEQSYLALKQKAAPGIDGVRWQAYGEGLNESLEDLHRRIHRGSYRAKPARRTMIPKADGTERSLSILCLEDKIVQQAVVFVLEAIYEPEFLGFSYGFRRGRSQHDALDALSTGIYRKRVNWVLDADIQGFFDAMEHDWILRFLRHRIADKRLLRLITKWLKVGTIHDGRHERSSRGTPQGAVISPILANVYLHYGFDLWANRWRQEKASADVLMVRYADDLVLGFEHEEEARAFLTEMRERLQMFGLTLHPEKTRLIQFGRWAINDRKRQGLGKPETFDFLGFTHFCTTSRKRGTFVIGRRTIRKRMRARLQFIKQELRRRMHDSIYETGRWLRRVLQGYLNYFAVSGNLRSLYVFFTQVRWYWLRALKRRSQKAYLSWKAFERRTTRFFPPIRLLHSHPTGRFDARTRRRSPVR
ncbi:MAG: group II intron reverse transcriptase/maturase [Proteobacteria bacterium]|nr:group II intron reverse transcriptase/maturase [Pseudomonadota bacterium]